MVRERPSKLQIAMENAINTARLSHDVETQVGSVLLKKDSMTVITTGYNGFIQGAPDSILPNIRPDKYKYIIHSEENLLMNCLRNSISVADCIVVCTMSPCSRCTRLLWQAGIRTVVCNMKYKDFDETVNMRDLKVNVSHTSEGFIQLDYEAKA